MEPAVHFARNRFPMISVASGKHFGKTVWVSIKRLLLPKQVTLRIAPNTHDALLRQDINWVEVPRPLRIHLHNPSMDDFHLLRRLIKRPASTSISYCSVVIGTVTEPSTKPSTKPTWNPPG
jgi:hypothetical protein